MKKLAAWAILVSGCAAPEPAPLPGPHEQGRDLSVAVKAALSENRQSNLTLEKALALAERLHPEFPAARARVEAARGRALQAGLYPNPELVARMEVAPIRGGTADEAEYVAGLSQRVPVGGRLGAAVRLEELERDRLIKEVEVRRLEVRSRVHAAFAAALYMEEIVRIQSDALRIAEKGVAITKTRVAAGDALPEDGARVELEHHRVRSEQDRALSLREAAFLALGAAIGEPGLEIESLSGMLERALEIPALQSVLASLDQHPLIESARTAVAAERAREELARAQSIPDFSLELFYRRQEASRTDAFDAGVGVTIPLFDRNQGRLQEARDEIVAAEARARLSRNELERQAREAHLKLTRALAQMRRLKDELLPLTDTVLRGAEARHGGGDMSLSDLLPIRRERISFQLSYLESLRDVLEAWEGLRPFLGGK